MGREAYDLVADLMSRGEFNALVKAKVEAWGGLLEPDAAALLVADELGRSPVVFSTVAEAVDGMPTCLRVRLEEVGLVREYRGRGGRRGKVLHLTVSDDSGGCGLVLWDEDADTVLARGDPQSLVLRLLECTPRRGPEGLEIVRGRWGTIIVEQNSRPASQL